MSKLTTTVVFNECEHYGDMDYYESELFLCGATIKSTYLDLDCEEAHIEIEVDDYDEFIEKFLESEVYGNSNFSN